MIVCPFCKSNNISLYLDESFSVASDASIVDKPIKAFLCKKCLNAFKIRNESDQSFIDDIYENYILHSVENNFEQRVAFDKYGGGIEKSAYLLEYLNSNLEMTLEGKLLDIGCHFGSFINYFSQVHPNWECDGYDVSSRYKNKVESISSNVTYTMSLNQAEASYDIIVISHVLEHVPDVLSILKIAKQLLKKNGKLFVQCNNLSLNPFLPIIFEQHSNFSFSGITNILNHLGFDVVKQNSQWIPKECSIIATKSNDTALNNWITDEKSLSKLEDNQALFRESINAIKTFNTKKTLCILGTSYTAKWIVKNLTVDIDFYIDDNENIQGSLIDGIEVISSHKIPLDSLVILPFPLEVAINIQNRLVEQYNNKVDFFIPPFEKEALR